MENRHGPNSPIVLKAKIDCCDDCPNLVREALLRINGVTTVEVDKQFNLAVVTGNVDPKMLINFISRAGKEATLGSPKDLKKCTNNNTDCDNHHFNEDHGIDDRKKICCPQEGLYPAIGKDKCPQNKNAHQKQHNNGNKCCDKGGPSYSKKRIDEDDHTVKNFEEPRFKEVDEKICRDPFCRIHKRNHGVPPGSDRPPMHWDIRSHGLGRSSYRNHSSRPPAWFREHPPPNGYPSPWVPPSGYGGSIYPGTTPFGKDYGDFYDDVGNRGCSIM